MAHTIMKQIYVDELKSYVNCEVLVFDEEEDLPNTDRREIVLQCQVAGEAFNELSDSESTSDINDYYPETELIDQYEDFDNRDFLRDKGWDYHEG